MLIAFLLIAAAAALQSAPSASAPAIENPRFEAAPGGNAVAGWALAPPAARAHYRLDTVEDENGGRAGRLAPVEGAPVEGAPAEAFGAALQSFGAAPWRGALVRFRARVRLARPGGSAALALSVARPAPKRAGFNDYMADRPILSEAWRSYEIVGRVAPDAETVTVQVMARGGAEVLMDDASFEPVEPDPAPPSAAASAYLDEALRILREGHIDSPGADWPRITANARAEIGGAATARDTYPAIRGVLGELGEPHTSLRPAMPAAAPGGPPLAAPVPPMPAYKLVAGRFGMVRLPWHIGSPEQGNRYRDMLREGLTLLGRHGVCGWIVDLRGNSGGNMWPMLNGLDPLLGAAPFGQFVTARREVTYWGRIGGEIVPNPAVGREPPAWRLRGGALPVAVLIDERTVSSGEMTAIAFAGRPMSRSFGAPSGGYTTGNRPIRLSDGAMLVLTGVYVRDRIGRDYSGRMTPDEAVEPALAQAAAIRWLAAQRSCAR